MVKTHKKTVILKFFRSRIFIIISIILLIIALILQVHLPEKNYYGSQTPYQPQQSLTSYEKPPEGFEPIYTQLVARHGARGLTDEIEITKLYGVWSEAKQANALTPLGKKLGPAIHTLMVTNQKLGYGNLTVLGKEEHRELAARLYQRMEGVFKNKYWNGKERKIIYVSSESPRAKESAKYFTRSLAQQNPGLASRLQKTKALKPVTGESFTPEPDGINQFLLYFHDLNKNKDKITSQKSSYYETYINSLKHQDYINNTTNKMNQMINAIQSEPKNQLIAREVLERLFNKRFVDNLKNQDQLIETANSLYTLYAITPAMRNEYHENFSIFIPKNAEEKLAYLADDAKNFYRKGPSMASDSGKNDQIAQILLDDFFNETDAIKRGDFSHAAKLRFTHAEVIIPFASLLRLNNVFIPTQDNIPYTYQNNPWRGATVAPFAANIQWDVYRNDSDQLLVKMLYNEKEIDFKPSCDSARYAPNSHFYHYERLAKCYDHIIKAS